MKNTPLLSTAYLPSIDYFAVLANAKSITIENAEHYQKQSYRNRTHILAANGMQSLSIPVVHTSSKMLIKEVQIDYKTNWQQHHLKTIESAYNNSPFYLYYKDFLLPFFQKRYTFLFDYNMEIITLLLQLMKIEVSLSCSDEFQQYEDNKLDFRARIHPKQAPLSIPSPLYSQVFDTKFGFTPNLSVIDLLFNVGNESKGYLCG
jgi:WbqC-like protein family.